MAGIYVSEDKFTMEDMMEKDPTLEVNGIPDEAIGPRPDPPERYGEPLPPDWIPLYRKPMRTPTRKLRIACIGAGISAMNLAYKIYHEWHDVIGDYTELVIYEANETMGGTWLVNTYPGVACDVPAHIYTFPFEPNPNWSAYYASGGEILEYFRDTVHKYDLARDVECGHRVSHAQFHEDEGKWHLKMETKSGTVEDIADIFVSAVGFLSKWRWPNIPGLNDFKGSKMHSADWDPSFDYTGKRIAVIGNGSSAIQILPQLVEKASHLTNFIRNPTYITAGLGSGIIGGQTQYYYTEEEKQTFRSDPEALKTYRKKIQAGSNRAFDMFVKNSEAQESGRKAVVEQMKAKLDGDEELAAKLTPDYEVGCRRSTPGPGYLEAFKRPNVTLITDPITSIDATGIFTGGSQDDHHEFDALILATGFDVSHKPPFPLIGLNSQSLSEYFDPEPKSYLSLCAPNFPNFFTFSGPNAPVGHGSLMASLGWSAEYICKWIQKIAEEDVKYINVKEEVVEEFNTYSDEVMQTLAWSGGCQSWYKNHRKNGKVTAVWAGSVISYHDMISELRPEDFNIVYRSRNRFRFMGNGRTRREYDPEADLAWYLKK
ncbi:putative sterigmatocystin biosynthesis monooxygenase stcW [Pseudocercospora fuligena]|uniref:Putative sterigmatocystin biosynthesis monooxygenase stcW n=1 Tax=Pseudocercospora fuligena TaxID=685502 RepID=A0A8H6VAK1_9PEZI|nr:putative sterigmatocystin biosynthesis monooxygenase stcW [Pseudocercospora fuligena]